MSSARLLRISARGIGISACAMAVSMSASTEASAQELVHRFINPSFGGNPFYSDHLFSIANIDRPEKPTTPTPTPSEEDQLVSQLQSSLNSQLQSQILDRIRNAQPGQSGNFTLGKSQISFTRTATETRVTFVNTDTGATRTIVIPVPGAATSSTSSSALALSAEQLLSASGNPGGQAASGPSGSPLGVPPLQ